MSRPSFTLSFLFLLGAAFQLSAVAQASDLVHEPVSDSEAIEQAFEEFSIQLFGLQLDRPTFKSARASISGCQLEDGAQGGVELSRIANTIWIKSEGLGLTEAIAHQNVRSLSRSRTTADGSTIDSYSFKLRAKNPYPTTIEIGLSASTGELVRLNVYHLRENSLGVESSFGERMYLRCSGQATRATARN